MLIAALLLSFASRAQTPPDTAGPLLTPEQFLGYKLGAQFTPHAELLRYVAHITAHTPGRLKLVRYGSSYEKRPLEVVQVASAETFGRLEDVRHNNLKLAGLESGPGQRQQPAVCWLSYNVHGNEAVSSEAVMQVLYDLANPQDQQMQDWLKTPSSSSTPASTPTGTTAM